MCVNIVGLSERKKKKKACRPLIFSPSPAFNFWPPPPHPLHHHSPFSLLHPSPGPSSSIPRGCPETLHYCRHGNTSTIWQWSRDTPPHPSSSPDSVCPCLPPLLSHSAPSAPLLSSPPKLPPAPLKTWLPDKNHQITAASGAYDDGTTPWGFPLSPTTP